MVSMVMMLTKRLGKEPILCLCILLQLLLLFSKTQALTLSVNGPLQRGKLTQFPADMIGTSAWECVIYESILERKRK